jgi:hypothetical protein
MMWWIMLTLGVANAQGKKNNQKVQPFMGGWGLSAQSILIPLEYPQSFPEIKSGGTPNFQQVGQDVGLGVKGTIFASRKYRASVNPYYHMGFNESNFRAMGLNVEVDQIAFRERNVWAYYGLGGGTSNLKFTSANESTLTATQLYAKGQVGGMYFDRTKAYELSIYATFGTTGREQITKNGTVYENSGMFSSDDALKGSLYYPTIGIQGTVYRGDFRKAMQNPAKKGKKGQKGKKGKGNKNQNGKR